MPSICFLTGSSVFHTHCCTCQVIPLDWILWCSVPYKCITITWVRWYQWKRRVRVFTSSKHSRHKEPRSFRVSMCSGKPRLTCVSTRQLLNIGKAHFKKTQSCFGRIKEDSTQNYRGFFETWQYPKIIECPCHSRMVELQEWGEETYDCTSLKCYVLNSSSPVCVLCIKIVY